jgi:hypothetical protein
MPQRTEKNLACLPAKIDKRLRCDKIAAHDPCNKLEIRIARPHHEVRTYNSPNDGTERAVSPIQNNSWRI